MNNDSISNNPVSSWGHISENPINSSGVTFAVKFMGYVPMPRSIQCRSNDEKDAFVKLCINTVVTCNASEQFKALRSQGDVGPYVSVHELDVFLNIADFTLTFFHIKEGRTFLLGRYMNDQVSHYKPREIDGKHYLGIVMKSGRNEKRECNVIMLDGKKVRDELITKMKKIDDIDHAPMSKLEARLRSTQDYAYRLHMLTCFHGKIEHEEACKRLSNPGDFIIRESVAFNGQFAATYQTGPRTFDRALIRIDNINVFKQFQMQESVLKNPVARPRH